MRLLLDENVPVSRRPHLLEMTGWNGIKDPSLYGQAAKERERVFAKAVPEGLGGKGYSALLVLNLSRLLGRRP